MKILADAGPDAVHLSSVAQALGLPLGDVEEIFGHSGELLYTAWQSRLRDEFAALVAQARTIMTGQFSSLGRDVESPSIRRAAVHVLIVAHRFDELREIVPADVQGIFSEYDRDLGSASDHTVLRAVVGWLCGSAIDPFDPSLDTLELLPSIGWYDGCWNRHSAVVQRDHSPALALTFDGVGTIEPDILVACTRIVAQGGVGRATLLRIARAAGYPSAEMYERFGRQEYLLAQYVHVVFSTLFAYPRMTEIMNDPRYAAMRLKVWLEPSLRIRRRALVESVLAAAFSPILASAYKNALENSVADLMIGNLSSDDRGTANVFRRFVASRHITLGLAIVEDVDLETWSRDWGPFLASFLSDSN